MKPLLSVGSPDHSFERHFVTGVVITVSIDCVYGQVSACCGVAIQEMRGGDDWLPLRSPYSDSDRQSVVVIDPTPFTGIEIKEVATKVACGVDETDRVRPHAFEKDAWPDVVADLWTGQRV